jgi:MmyB-like transcription regulator ligand binding domain
MAATSPLSAAPCTSPVECASALLRWLIANLGTKAAYIIGRRWDYLAWNDAATALLGDFGALPHGARNRVWQTFMDPSRRSLFTD